MFESFEQIHCSGKYLSISFPSPKLRFLLKLGIGFIQKKNVVGISTFVGHDSPQREEIH
jgi:hypothetical protein